MGTIALSFEEELSISLFVYVRMDQPGGLSQQPAFDKCSELILMWPNSSSIPGIMTVPHTFQDHLLFLERSVWVGSFAAGGHHGMAASWNKSLALTAQGIVLF